MVIELNRDNFESEVIQSKEPVLVDFWGPQCRPCVALTPIVEGLEQEYLGRLKVVKVNAVQNRMLCARLRVMGLPTFLIYKDGVEINRLVGEHITRDDLIEAINAAVTRNKYHAAVWMLRRIEMELKGKMVIVIGERDGIQGPAIAACVKSAGAEPVLIQTQCFVWTAAGALDLDGQENIKKVVEQYGKDNLIVILGTPDADSAELYAETVVHGDPSYAGPLAGVALGLPVYHIMEPVIKTQIEPGVYKEHLELMEIALEVEKIAQKLKRVRHENSQTSSGA